MKSPRSSLELDPAELDKEDLSDSSLSSSEDTPRLPLRSPTFHDRSKFNSGRGKHSRLVDEESESDADVEKRSLGPYDEERDVGGHRSGRRKKGRKGKEWMMRSRPVGTKKAPPAPTSDSDDDLTIRGSWFARHFHRPKKDKSEHFVHTSASPASCCTVTYVLISVIFCAAFLIFATTVLRKEADLEARLKEKELELEAAHEAKVAFQTYVPTGTMPNVALPSPTGVFQKFPELQNLLVGNRIFRDRVEEMHHGELEELAVKGQHPRFAYLGCSDSRVPATDIMNTNIGDLFVARSVGNLYEITDLNSQAVLTYAIENLGVRHILVMGHLGCGAVQAAIASPSNSSDSDLSAARIEHWIRPIRAVWEASSRPEIRAAKEKFKTMDTIPAPNRTDPHFVALVEENVKSTVHHVSLDPVVQKSWRKFLDASLFNPLSMVQSQAQAAATGGTAGGTGHKRSSVAANSPPIELYVHGMVYDIENGLVRDLGVSLGPDSIYNSDSE